MESHKNFLRHAIVSLFDFMYRDLVVFIVFEYYYNENECMNKTFWNLKYGRHKLFHLPSIFFTKISVLKVGTFAHELRDLVPSVCFRILPFCKLFCPGHRFPSSFGTFQYCDSLAKLKKTCSCKICQRNTQNKPNSQNEILGGKFEILKDYHRYVLNVNTRNDIFTLKSFDMSYQRNETKKKKNYVEKRKTYFRWILDDFGSQS